MCGKHISNVISFAVLNIVYIVFHCNISFCRSYSQLFCVRFHVQSCKCESKVYIEISRGAQHSTSKSSKLVGHVRFDILHAVVLDLHCVRHTVRLEIFPIYTQISEVSGKQTFRQILKFQLSFRDVVRNIFKIVIKKKFNEPHIHFNRIELVPF